MKQLRLLIVDDHAVVREGLGAVLRRRAEMAVMGEADSAAAARPLRRRTSIQNEI